MSIGLSERDLRAVPIFPLPNLVLFPGATLALHIFEPRYREMMADCLSQGPMAMAVARLQAGWESDYHGRPPTHEIAGVGRIVSHLRQRDGTYDIQLEGVTRVRLHELPFERSYRRAAAEPLIETLPEGGLPPIELSTLLSLASQIVQIVERENPVARNQLLASLDDAPARMIDKLADQFVADPDARQRLLELTDVGERLQQLKRNIAELHLALVTATSEDGPRTVH